MATTYAHAITAVYEALTTSTGKTRALGASDLFRRGYPVGVPSDVRSREAAIGKTVFVAIQQYAPDPGTATEMGSDRLWSVQVVVSRDYHLGFEYSLDGVEAVMVEVADDTAKITDALCWPNALDETAGGDPTGLAGEALGRPGSSTRIRIETVGDGRSRLLNAQTVFPAFFSWTA